MSDATTRPPPGGARSGPVATPAAGGHWAPPPLRPVLQLIARMLLVLGGFMLLPALLDLSQGHPDWRPFAASALGTALAGGLLQRLTRCELQAGLNLRQAFVLTPLSWLAICAFAAVPFLLSQHPGLGGNLTNAVFESVSGLTTTGSTAVSRLDEAPPGILLWRALLQWLGGIGIIATALAILPTLGVGGMQLFRTESSDRSEKVMPRVRQIALAIVLTYLALTVLCGLAYALAGMDALDAAAHALTTISTAGFSTSDQSLARWDNPAVHWIAIAGMLAGALPFVLYVRLVRRDWAILRDSQVRALLGLVATVTAGLTLWLVLRGTYGVWEALQHAALATVSIVTTTGFASADYTQWGGGVVGLVFGLMFVGGCTGSTTGGMKIFRLQVMAVMLRGQFLRLLYPRGVFPRLYDGKPLPDDVIGSVVVFFTLYFICYGVLTILLMAMELDFLTSASAAVSMLSNVGAGLGPVIGPAGHFGNLPDGAKWLLCFAMLLGRLELFTVLILFMPRFWRG
ncbi:TrkH family potassium uptake protein [Pseudoroseomonas sp. WGS1072]|uniref:TrkH family potassium uptake protein n=1 Tax=Roseomonas sp. WGS1072 TaxID=3366816 RepID=UPI003BF2B2C3